MCKHEERQAMYKNTKNVTSRRLRVTTVADEKQ
jgi:hypothetical protein